MNATAYNVLFVCTGNSARSILAEGLMNHLGRARFKAYSAGSHPAGKVNPLSLETLAWLQLPVDGYRSKSWEEFARPGAPAIDFVFTVCDKAAGEGCPVWPGQPITAHWGLPDPDAFAANASKAEKLQAFHETALVLKRRIELMLALPLPTLDKMSLQKAVRDIGQA